MKIVAVMPAYNEATRIGAAIEAVRLHVPLVLVVDDGSSDETAEAARRAGAFVVRHGLNRGQGAALRTGNAAALLLGADCVVHIDADGQHDPSFLPTLLAPLLAGTSDIVYGSRFLGVQASGMPFSRRLLLLAGRYFSRFVLGIPRTITDPQSGLRAMTAHAARSLRFVQDRKAHCSELLRVVTRSAYRYAEVPVHVAYSRESLAKGNRNSDAFEIVWQLIIGSFQK